MMTDTTGERTARAAGQIAWQRRAAAALAKILERAAAEGLPPIAWTVATAGSKCAANAWPTQRTPGAMTSTPGAPRSAHGPTASPTVRASAQADDGTTRLVDQWDGVKMPGSRARA